MAFLLVWLMVDKVNPIRSIYLLIHVFISSTQFNLLKLLWYVFQIDYYKKKIKNLN